LNLERFHFTLHSAAFFLFTNDLMINAALQEYYRWQVPKAAQPPAEANSLCRAQLAVA
jgi:hypothetical protein